MDILLKMCQAVNPAIKNLTWDYILYINLPFNVLKDGIVLVVTFVVYRSIHKILHFDRAPQKQFLQAIRSTKKAAVMRLFFSYK
jgi:hypothetical protein